MRKEKSILRRLIPWVVALALIAALVVFVGIPLYSQNETVTENPPEVSYFVEKPKTLTMENDSLLFELNTGTTQFVLTEKNTGRVWRSNPENAASDPVAVAANKNMLQSTLVVTYSSADGVIDYNNYQYSIQNGNYAVEQRDDGSIAVIYSVGKIEKIVIGQKRTARRNHT